MPVGQRRQENIIMNNSSSTVKNDLKLHHAMIVAAMAVAATIMFGPPRLVGNPAAPQRAEDSADAASFIQELRQAAAQGPKEHEIQIERSRRLAAAVDAEERAAASKILLVPKTLGEEDRAGAEIARQEALFQRIKDPRDERLFRAADRAQELSLLAHELDLALGRDRLLGNAAIARAHLLRDAAGAAQDAAGRKLAEYSGGMAGARKIIDQELGDGRARLGYATADDRKDAIAATAERGALALGASSSGIEEMAEHIEQGQEAARGAEALLGKAVVSMARPFIADGGHREEMARAKRQMKTARQVMEAALSRAEAGVIQKRMGVEPNAAAGPAAMEMALSSDWKAGLADLRQAAEKLLHAQALKIQADMGRERQAAMATAMAIAENPKALQGFKPWELAMLWQWMAPLSSGAKPVVFFDAFDLHYAGQSLSGNQLQSIQPAEWQKIAGALSMAGSVLDLEQAETSWLMGESASPLWRRSALLEKLAPPAPPRRESVDSESRQSSREIALALKALERIAENIRLRAKTDSKPA